MGPGIRAMDGVWGSGRRRYGHGGVDVASGGRKMVCMGDGHPNPTGFPVLKWSLGLVLKCGLCRFGA